MKYVLARGVAAAFLISVVTSASGMNIPTAAIHHQTVDETAYPWSAIGKLFNELGNECSGVIISHQQILTAAHCLFNYKTKRFITASAIHFLVGYRSGHYAVHSRIAYYQVGAGFDPMRYDETSKADWAILTVTEPFPHAIEPIALSDAIVPRGTRAVLVGYPQDRAYAMTADRDCALQDSIDDGRLLQHTCRGIKGYSGAPILVHDTNGHVKIAGIQIATVGDEIRKTMLAVPAHVIWRQAAQGRTASTIAERAYEKSRLANLNDLAPIPCSARTETTCPDASNN